MENEGELQLLSENPLDLIALEIGPTLNVKCGELTGILFTDNFSSYRECISCIHGLVRPVVFEKYAGKASSKNWRKTIRNADTGYHLYSMIQSAQLTILDEKRRSIKIKTPGDIRDVVHGKLKRKRGRPKKSLIDKNCSQDNDLYIDHSNNDHLDTTLDMDLELSGINLCPETVKRKRKKTSHVPVKPKNKLIHAAVLNCLDVNAGEQCTPLDNKSGDSDADSLKKLNVNKRGARTNKCKPIKRTRCNDFERGLTTISKHRIVQKNYKTCPHCEAEVPDADALKYHDSLFHESVSNKLFCDHACEINDLVECNQISDESLVPATLSDSATSLSPNNIKGLASLDVFCNKLTRGTIAKLTSIGMQKPLDNEPGPSEMSCINSESYQKDESIPISPGEQNRNNTLLAQLSNQYQEIIGLSKETLQQTSILNERMNELTKVVQEVKSDIIDISKYIADDKQSKLVNGFVSGVDDQTLSRIFDKFMNSENLSR